MSIIKEMDITKEMAAPELTNIRMLTDNAYEPLNWTGNFQYKGLVRIRTPGDGSCFFHAIAGAYFKPYIEGKIDSDPIDRRDLIKKLRKDLSLKLATRVDPLDPQSPTYYDILSRGELGNIANEVPEYSLQNMQAELDSDTAVDNVYNEFISDQINKDIYILDLTKQDVYMTGNDIDILYKDRMSIVILYLPGHYELVGVQEDGVIKTLFDSDHPLIEQIRTRIAQLSRSII